MDDCQTELKGELKTDLVFVTYIPSTYLYDL